MCKLLFFLLAIAATVSSSTTPVKKCKNVSGDLFKQVVVSVDTDICTSLPCKFVRGKDVKADITFLVREEVKEIQMMCNATVFGVTIPQELPNATKGCDFLTNTKCPVPPNTEAQLRLTMNVLPIYPKINLDVTFYLLDQAKKMISCFEVSAKVVDKRSIIGGNNSGF